ncbi:MAG: EamA family transporter, partial [Kiritimatiellia bacterium]
MSLRRRGLLQAYTSVILMGIGITVVQTIDLPPQTQVWYRVITALPGLLLFALLSGQSLRLELRFRRPLFAAALLTACHWIALFFSITMSTVAAGMISFFSYPVFSTLFEAVLQKRKPFRKDVVISGLSFLGVLLLTPLTGASLEMLPGVCVGVVSAVFWAAR